MRVDGALTVAAGLLALVSCGGEGPAAQPGSGITGLVHLGPQCPVQTAGEACDDRPAAKVTVTVSKRIPGEVYAAGAVVARTTTDAAGTFRLDVAPGEYVVTADAGMSCELMDARVTQRIYSRVDVACDTGIR